MWSQTFFYLLSVYAAWEIYTLYIKQKKCLELLEALQAKLFVAFFFLGGQWYQIFGFHFLFRNEAILAYWVNVQCYNPLPMLLLPTSHCTIFAAFAVFALLVGEHAVLATFTAQKCNCTGMPTL